MTKPQLLVFDLDGTLIDSRADLAAGVNHMRANYGLPPLPADAISGYIGNGVRKLVERSLHDAADVDVEEAMRINRDYYVSHLTVHTTLYDGVSAGLRQLAAAGHKLALLTNKPGDASREIMEHFGLAAHFSEILGGGDVAELKPQPGGIFQCLETTGIDVSNAWMIGDHYTDLAAAQNAGVKSALVTYGFGNAQDYTADEYFASFSELTAYFV
ncbi:MAG: HAD-IA family hydrolase [Kiritimatiellales bacterium]|nr:HAD-IA family hydrolase [Kiritimatiellales bacterium]